MPVAPAPNRCFCIKVQEQVTSFYVTDTGSPGLGSGRPQPTMGGSGCVCLPTDIYLGQCGVEVAGPPMQQDHSDCPRVAIYALVLGPRDHVQSDPSFSAQSAESVNSALQSDFSQESAKPKPTCLAHRASAIKEQAFP